ncbi:hypothetical protein DCC26_11335 [Auritidibacter sp. NML120779]|nr:hypothetical protein DCC26_11335 [Auritidibacter sp. NML120779]
MGNARFATHSSSSQRILAMVVKLAWLHELPHSQIALVMEIPTGTVKSRVSRARQLLQESVRRQDA